MKPTEEQLGYIGFLLPDSIDPQLKKKIGIDIWNFVEMELNKIHSLPAKSGHWYHRSKYKCKACSKWSYMENWDQEILENVTTLTCPGCGAIHSEMIKGDEQ